MLCIKKVLDSVKNAVLLVCDFGRLKPDQGSLVKDVIVPYSHRINPYNGDIGVENRNTLLFFMGNRFRKEVHCLFLYVNVEFSIGILWLFVGLRTMCVDMCVNVRVHFVFVGGKDPRFTFPVA